MTDTESKTQIVIQTQPTPAPIVYSAELILSDGTSVGVEARNDEMSARMNIFPPSGGSLVELSYRDLRALRDVLGQADDLVLSARQDARNRGEDI